MKATHTFTLRVPSGWQTLGSANVRAMLANYLQSPTPNLPSDPGPGNVRLSLSLPARAVKVISALLNESESAALRRVIAASRGLPLTAQARSLPLKRSRLLETEVVKPRALLPGLPKKPMWYFGSSEKWEREPQESKEALLAMMAKAQPKPAKLPSPQTASEPLLVGMWAVPALRFVFLVTLLLFGLGFLFRRASRVTQVPAKPEPPRFRSWEPQ